MAELFLIVASFLISSLLIVFSGARLSKYGDIIAEHTGIGKAWLGLILMSTITSLPELITGISSIVLFDTPDIAAGDIMGSCAFNLLILAVLDYFVPGKPLSSLVTKGHIVAGFFGIFLLTLSVMAIVFGNAFPRIGWFSSVSVLMIVIYFIAVRIIFQNEKRSATVAPKEGSHLTESADNKIPLNIAIMRYTLFAVLVVASAVALPYFADHLATLSGLNKSFVGTLFVAATTSLPELAVSISAVRIGSVDIAVGNLLGSNIFNMLILAFDDILYRKGPMLELVNPDHALSGLVALLMTAVVGISIVYSTPYKRYLLGVDALILVLLYATLMLTLYYRG